MKISLHTSHLFLIVSFFYVNATTAQIYDTGMSAFNIAGGNISLESKKSLTSLGEPCTGFTSSDIYSSFSGINLMLDVNENLKDILLPDHYELGQNYPNPFNHSTCFKYQIPLPAHVKIEVYDILGRWMATIMDVNQSPGFHSLNWNGMSASGMPLPSGTYLYLFTANNFKDIKKMTLVK